MSWLSEAHNDWHTANGWDRVCPLDCGAGEPDYANCPTCGAYLDPAEDCGEADCVKAAAEAVPVTVPVAVPEDEDPWDPPF